MKVVIAADKFKGSITSSEVCQAAKLAVQATFPDATIFTYPMADGGDGFIAAIKHYLSIDTIACTSVDPLGRSIDTVYAWNAQTKTAFIELASSSGLVLLTKAEQNPLETSTYGTGLQVADAIQRGARKIVLGLGGSATNDGGMGILAALGFRFYDQANKALAPKGSSLAFVKYIVPPTQIPNIEWHIASDVQNTAYGPAGAAYVYGEQKGATPEMIQVLDKGMRHFVSIVEAYANNPIHDIPGTGAAGGVLVGLYPWFRPIVKSGVDMIVDMSGLLNNIHNADLLITGEGKFDSQSFYGKVVGRMLELGREKAISVIVLCGLNDLSPSQMHQFSALETIALYKEGRSVDYCIRHAAELVQDDLKNFLMKKSTALKG